MAAPDPSHDRGPRASQDMVIRQADSLSCTSFCNPSLSNHKLPSFCNSDTTSHRVDHHPRRNHLPECDLQISDMIPCCRCPVFDHDPKRKDVTRSVTRSESRSGTSRAFSVMREPDPSSVNKKISLPVARSSRTRERPLLPDDVLVPHSGRNAFPGTSDSSSSSISSCSSSVKVSHSSGNVRKCGMSPSPSFSSSSSSLLWSSSSTAWVAQMTLFSLFLISSVVSLSAEPCIFPPEWAGHWFQKGVPDPIRIGESDISEKGSCKEISGDKFLIENRQERCIRCMVINEKHANVLQYKETFCFPYQRAHHRHLRDVCADINGDAPLYSLFRLDTPPVACPFAGPFRFTYSRGHGECREPYSSIDSCTEDSRLLFRFQACADVAGSESRVEELSCVGEWKEGSVRYLVGKLEHRSAKTDEDKFRCFVFEKSRTIPGGLAIAQSGDATCDGLSSSIEGSRTMKLEPSEAVVASCTFPRFLTQPQNWRTLDGSEVYRFHQNSTFSVHNTSTGQIYTTITCVRDLTPDDQSAMQQFAVHAVSGCKIGYMCIRIYKRNNHIVEIEGSNNLAKDEVDACSQHQNYQNYLSITTFQPSTETCPAEGIYSVEVPGGEEESSWTNAADDTALFICSEQSLLTARCNSNDHMQLLSKCSETSDSTRNFFCHGTWKDNDTTYTVVSSSEDKKQYCLTHTGSEAQVLKKMTIHSGSCPHPSNGHASPSFGFPHSPIQASLLHQVKRRALVLNLLDHGKCQSPPSTGAASGTTSHIHIKYSVVLLSHSLAAALSLCLFNFLISKL